MQNLPGICISFLMDLCPVRASLGEGQDEKQGRRGHQSEGLWLQCCSFAKDAREGHAMVRMAPILGDCGPLLSSCPVAAKVVLF